MAELLTICKKKLANQFFALERNEIFCRSLRTSFKDSIEIFQTDIFSFQTQHRFDVVLMLWSFIVEFHRHEQMVLIKHLYQLLNDQGKLIFDVPINPLHTKIFSDNEQKIVTNYGTVHGYFPDNEEVFDYIEQLDYSKLDKFEYLTDTNVSRKMYILFK